jgi:predicted TIM-barrel fold metal-dependent hydrolase
MPLTYFDAFTKFGPRPRVHGAHPWSFQHLLDELNHCSISAALVSSTGQTLYDAMFENRLLSEKLADHDWLFPIWNVAPHWTGEWPEPEKLTKLMQDSDVRAVTLYPRTNGWHLTSPSSKPLLDELERTKTLTIIDWQDVDAALLEPTFEQHPNLPVLIRGVTWSQQRQLVPMLRRFKQVHVAFDFLQINYGIERFTEWGLEDQLVFCSNAPTMSAGAHRFYVDYAMVPEKVRQKVAGGNLSRLLKGLTPPRERVNSDEDDIMAEARQGKPLSTLVLDMHAHMLDEGLDGAGGGYAMYNGGPKGTYELNRHMGVDGIGIMSWNGTVGVHAEQGNQCVRDAMDAYPDYYWGLATFDVLHESADTMREQMEATYADKRFLGLKPYPQYGIPYNDKRYDCWWEFGNERHLYCGLHPHNWFAAGEFDGICPKWPNLTCVAYHCGGDYTIADTAIELANKYANFMIEITLTPVCGGIIDYLVKNSPPGRVVYGSDLPMRDPRQQLGWVVYSKLDLLTKKQVLGGNAKRLLDHVRSHQK